MQHYNQIDQILEEGVSATLTRCKVSSSLEERLYATTDANHNNVTSIEDVFRAV